MSSPCKGEGATHYACDCTMARLWRLEALADALRGARTALERDGDTDLAIVWAHLEALDLGES